jgi:acetyl esterase/lipase
MTNILDLPAPIADRRIQYGSAAQHFIDIRTPAAAPAGAIMLIHGGFWRAKYDLEHVGHLCAALANAGYTTFNVEYRRIGDEGGGWPGTLDDLRSAFQHIRQHHGSDLIVMGHSAGGQLALALAAYEQSVTRVVSLAGVLNLWRAYELHLSNDAVVEFLAGAPQQVPQRYREASPTDLTIAAHQLIVTGSTDHDVPSELSRDYVAQKQAAGEKVEFLEIPQTGHFDLIDPRSAAFPLIVSAIKKLR